MSTSSAISRPVFDAWFTRLFVGVLGVVPLGFLAWDAVVDALPANGVNFVIRTTGLIGLICLALSLAVTPVRRLTGWNGLIAARRSLGLLGFGYICVHLAIFFWFDREASISSTVAEIIERRYLNFGFAALVLMIPLAITSTDGWVSRLGPRRWKAIHRLAYIATIAGVVHYYLLVKSDVTRPLVFAGIVGGLMIARVLWNYLDLRRALAAARVRSAVSTARPGALKKFWSGELRVARVFAETHDVRTFRMVPIDGGELPFKHLPGQYLNLALSIGGVATRRSYTIASSPTRSEYLEITVKRKPDGWGSHHLHDSWHEGDRVAVSAPAGKFHFTGAGHSRVLLLAGGVGVTPLMSIARALTDRAWPGHIYFMFAVQTHADIIFSDELAYLADRFPNFHLCITISGAANEAWEGERGRIDAAMLRRRVPEFTSMAVYLCGPAPMMAAMRWLLVENGVPEANIHTEDFISPTSRPGDAVMPAPNETGVLLDADGETQPQSIAFSLLGREVEAEPGATVLETAESAGIELSYECRSGICGQCKVRLISGRVTMLTQDALTAEDRRQGLILACQARPQTPITIEARSA